jgi:hypothetical protein
MIKYLLTEDIIFFPELKFRLSAENPYFEEVKTICKNKEATLEDIKWLNPNLNYTSDDISIEQGEYTEIYYNGKYYPFPNNFLSVCLSLIKDRTSLSVEAIAKFLLKCLKNPNYEFNELFNYLSSIGFLFLNNGNILVYKNFVRSDFKNKNIPIEENLIILQKFSSKEFSLIEINPSEIDDGKVMNYIVRDFSTFNVLRNTYINSFLLETIYTLFVRRSEDNELFFSDLSAILGKDIKTILHKGHLSNLDFENKNSQDIIPIILRICQD